MTNDEQRGIVVIDYYRMHLLAEERKREAAIRRAVIEELAREADGANLQVGKWGHDNEVVNDSGWLGDWLRQHVEEEG